jgi:hypothetical protein
MMATQEAEIQRISVPSQMGQIVCKTLSQKNPSQKRAGNVVGLGLHDKGRTHTGGMEIGRKAKT